MKHVFFFEFCNLTPHLETSLEIAKAHLENGDKVYYYFLGHDTPYRESVFPSRFSGKILGPLLPERRGAKLIRHKNLSFITSVKLPVSKYRLDNVKDIDELKAIRYSNWDLGMAVASSLISLTKDSEPDMNKYQGLAKIMADSAASVYDFVSKLLKKQTVDKVYIFNGRFCNQRAVLRACEFIGAPYLIHERGANKDLYFLRPFMPHDKNRIQDEMRTLWNSLENKFEGKEIAENWFRSRRSGVDTDWYSYSKSQQKGLLPKLDIAKKVITYFHSSDDEYAAIGDQFLWIGWKNQFDAVIKMMSVAERKDDVQLVIRLHPHLAKKSKKENLKWVGLNKLSNKTIIIEPTSQVDSYALIDQSDLVISSGSKAGIESVFYGKPSVLLGPSPYDALGVTYKAHSERELEKLIDSKELPQINKENLLMYGYWWATHGDIFKYYKSTSLSEGRFLGQNLQYRPLFLKIIISLQKKLLRENSKL